MNFLKKAIVILGFLAVTIVARASESVTDLLDDGPRSTKTVLFSQSASTGTDATTVAKVTLAYFTSSDCTGAKSGSGFYTTPDGTSFTISVGSPFGIVAASVWNVGSTKLSIADMTTIQSIAVTFKSTNSNTPQAAFTNGSAQVISYACVPVTCAGGECTSGSGTQSFTLKTTAAVGDPADGGVIGCQNTSSSPNLFNLVVVTSDSSTSIGWGGHTTLVSASSITDGALNTSTIVTALGTGATYAARLCNELSITGGFTSGWFLAAGDNSDGTQTNCLYTNKVAIGNGSVAAGGSGYSATNYWSSTEGTANGSWRTNFSTGGDQISNSKDNLFRARCVRAF